MTWFQLRAVKSCCTGFVCPVLDKFRRSVSQPSADERVKDDLVQAKLQIELEKERLG